MGKMKVHELAKELNIPSKELVERLNNMGYSIKSHLSTLEEQETEEIRKKLSGKVNNETKKGQNKKEKKPIAPVIIRREITRVETTDDKQERQKNDRSDLGVVQRRTDTTMNIKYRNEPRKVSSIITNSKGEKKNITNTDKNQVIKKEQEVAPKTNLNEIKSEMKQEEGNQNVKKIEEKENANKINKVEENKNAEKKDEAMKDAIKDKNSLKTSNEAGKIDENNRVAQNNNNKNPDKTQNNRNGADKSFNKDQNRGNDKNFNKNNQDKNNFNRNNQDGNNRDRNGQDRNNDKNRNNDRNFSRDGQNRNNDRNFTRDGQNRNYDKRANRDAQGRGDKSQSYKDKNSSNRTQYNKDGYNRGNKQQRQPENKIEKGIKEIMSSTLATDIPSKEVARENVRTEYKDKQKDNRKFEEDNMTRKSSKNKASRAERDEINYDKLKDLQTESHFSDMFDDTESKMFDYYDLSKSKRKNNSKKKNNKKPTESKNHIEQKIFDLTDIEIPENISVKDLAEKLKKQASEVIKKLMDYGLLATLNQELDYDTAFLVASEFGVTAHKKEVISDEDILFDETDDNEEDLVPRPPIVVVMGHVDHGKTSLLDAIRSTNVIEKEAGGITQHIGAYKVKVNDREITFLDTPGHEAFTAMRARGAQVTDIAIIIVAANDGIMPQTVEAINHAKAAGVSIVVAINKIDLPGANVEKVKQELTEYGLVPEEWGGDTICVPISAKQKINIDGLLEILLLVADMKELKSNPNKQSKGTVIEARLDKNTGITVSLLVQRGTLNIGDTIVVGSVIGKIRAMKDDKGQRVKSAGPSTPVEIVGLPEVPEAGDVFYEVENEKVAKHLIEKRKSKQREDMIRKSAPVTLDNLFNQIEQGKLKDLNIIIKADVQGSVQALRQSLEKIQNEEARVRIIHANVGAITESDVTLAKVTNSIILGFNVRPESMAKSIADKEGVEIKIYSVIYTAIDDVTAALKGMLKPKYKEVIQGTAEVRQVFKITNVGMIAGCYVIDGKIVRNSGVRVLRDNVVIHEGKLVSLKREKDDAREVATGYECGVQVEDYNDIKVGDHIESFIMEEIKR